MGFKTILEEIFVADLADFVADFVAESTKPLDYQEVLEANARCGRDSNRAFPHFNYVETGCVVIKI